MMALALTANACGDDDSSSGGESLDLGGAAAGAQRAIDQGDSLGDCPWGQQAIIDAVGAVVTLVPEFADPGIDNGQVFSGGDVDIVYCEIYHSGETAATEGIDEMRIDVHPGTADLQQYLDEEWGGDADGANSSDLSGGTVTSWCPDDDQCIAAWQGDGLFVALVAYGVTTAADATTALEAALPVVVGGLAR
ncbi:MAG: hypothetical protein Q8M22_05100 [Actinomycetota bacterium]|nr:hypothetical protein [Actinomycetota bacterium]